MSCGSCEVRASQLECRRNQRRRTPACGRQRRNIDPARRVGNQRSQYPRVSLSLMAGKIPPRGSGCCREARKRWVFRQFPAVRTGNLAGRCRETFRPNRELNWRIDIETPNPARHEPGTRKQQFCEFVNSAPRGGRRQGSRNIRTRPPLISALVESQPSSSRAFRASRSRQASRLRSGLRSRKAG